MKQGAEKKTTREPRQSRGIKTRARIIKAGERLFAERGFHAVLADDIARAAGVSVGTYYAYFADKRGLFLVILDQFIAEAATVVSEWSLRMYDADLDQEALLRHAVEMLVTAHETPRVIFREAERMALHDEDIRERLAANDRAVRKVLEQTLRRMNPALPSPATLAYVTYHAAEGVVHNLGDLTAEDGVERDAVINELSRLLSGHLLATPEPAHSSPS